MLLSEEVETLSCGPQFIARNTPVSHWRSIVKHKQSCYKHPYIHVLQRGGKCFARFATNFAKFATKTPHSEVTPQEECTLLGST